MSRTLHWHRDGDAVVFTCLEGGTPLPIAEWAALPVALSTENKAQPGFLLAMLDQDGVETVENDHGIRVSADKIAAMETWEARGIGLPPLSPHRLKLDRQGLFTDRDFSLKYSFVTAKGQTLPTARSGAIATIGDNDYTLHEPVFSVVTAVDELAQLQTRTFEARAPMLERIQRALPNEALADPYLATTTITSADRFTIRPRMAGDGRIDFDVQPVRGSERDAERFVHSLPDAREDEWNRHFRNLPLRGCYPAGGGHYLVVSPVLREALGVAKRMTTASADQKREFVRNPRTQLRQALPQLSEEAVESIFWESAEYSDRVRDIGLWQPRVLPFLKKSGIEWLPDERMGLNVGGSEIPVLPADAQKLVERLEAAKAKGEPWVEHEGQRVPVTGEAIDAARELAEIARTYGLPEEQRHRAQSPVDLQADAGRLVLLIKDNLEDEGFSRHLKPRASEVEDTPEVLLTSLLDFQQHGFCWLQQLWASGAPGVLLADDMGLGKTLQTLAFLAWRRQRRLFEGTGHRPTLTVAPTGLLKNWLAEHDKHLKEPGLGEILEAHGQGLADLRSAPRTVPELQMGVPTLDTARMRSADWVLTTYETVRDYQHSFGEIAWDIVVFDEAQKIKNPQTLLTDAAKAMNADFTIALTGTPVENRLVDLWTIVDAVDPGRLGTLKEFVTTYEPGGAVDQTALRDLNRRLAVASPPLLKRRTKKTTLQGLPPISYHATRVPMPPPQADAYASAVCAARARTGGMLETLQDLRSVSLHPRTEMATSDDDFVEQSARLSEAMRILESVASRGEKALVFVDARAMQAALMEILQRRFHLPDPPLVINGDVPGAKRRDRAESFQKRSGFGVLILSPRAGGVGLTITEANHVVHLGRWWNPAIEDQATDRVYRIGQTRPVHVYTPLAVHPEYGDASFDVRLDELLSQKRSLSQELLAPPEASKGDLETLLKTVVAEPRDLGERA